MMSPLVAPAASASPTRLTAVRGRTAAKKPPMGMPNLEQRKRFWGLPTGMAILPRLAATVWRVTM